MICVSIATRLFLSYMDIDVVFTGVVRYGRQKNKTGQCRMALTCFDLGCFGLRAYCASP